MRREILEVAAIAGQAVQAEYGRGFRAGSRIDPRVEAQSIVARPEQFVVG